MLDKRYLQKKVFVRRIPSSDFSYGLERVSDLNTYEEAQLSQTNFARVTQEEFMRELDPRSHDINDIIKYPDKAVYKDTEDSNGEIIQVLDKYSPVARVTLAMQKFIANRQALHLLGNPVNIKSSRKLQKEIYDDFVEYWRFSDVDSDMLECCQSVKQSGDGAIYFNVNSKGEIVTKILSYTKGDVLIPTFENDGETLEAFARLYNDMSMNEQSGIFVQRPHCELYTKETIQTYRQDTTNKWVAIGDPIYHNLGIVPIAYYREEDVAWGCVQKQIDLLERILSQNRDSNEYFAYGILFIKGTDVEVLPNKTSQGKVISSEDESADAKLIEQKDVSPSLKFEYEEYRKAIYEHTGTVVIDPKDFKGGDISGATIRNYYDPAIQQAMSSIPKIKPFLNQVKNVMMTAFEKKNGKIENFSVKINLDIYVPRNLSEEIFLLTQSVGSGILSKQTASEKNKFASSSEYEKIKNEAEEQIVSIEKNPPTSQI